MVFVFRKNEAENITVEQASIPKNLAREIETSLGRKV